MAVMLGIVKIIDGTAGDVQTLIDGDSRWPTPGGISGLIYHQTWADPYVASGGGGDGIIYTKWASLSAAKTWLANHLDAFHFAYNSSGTRFYSTGPVFYVKASANSMANTNIDI